MFVVAREVYFQFVFFYFPNRDANVQCLRSPFPRHDSTAVEDTAISSLVAEAHVVQQELRADKHQLRSLKMCC